MKKLIYLLPLALILIGFWGCEKESYVAKFDKLPQERMKAQIDSVKNILTSADNGWIGTLPTAQGGGYAFYMQFDKEGYVNMVADLTDQTATKVKKSEYRIRQDMGAALTFGTYTYISILNNPDTSAFHSPDVGKGFKSDINFIYDHSSEDSMVFIGKRYRQPFSLVKATAAQKDKYMNGGYLTAIDKWKTYFINHPNLYFDYNNDLKVSVEANSGNSMNAGKRITFTALYGKDSIASVTQLFAFTVDQMAILHGGLEFDGISFVKIAWKDANTLALYDNTGKEYVLKNSPTPLLPLYMLWGTKYNGMLSDYMQIYPGTSDKGADILSFYHQNLCGYLRYCFDRGRLEFVWDIINHRLSLKGIEEQTSNGGSWTTTVTFNYTVDDNGVYTFTLRDDFDGGYVGDIMIPLKDFLLNNKVKFDYYVDGADVYGAMESVDDPSIAMTFVLQK